MTNRVLIIYRWATLGGVERILLNRGMAIHRAGLSAGFDVCFLHDTGAIRLFQNEIDAAGVRDTMKIVPASTLGQYDLIISIDTPEVLNMAGRHQRVALECHTAYVENRTYLSGIGESITALGVPSSVFLGEIEKEHGRFGGRLCLVRNFVLRPKIVEAAQLPRWSKRPVLHLGRLDRLKNVTELLDGLAEFERHHGHDLILLLVGARSDDVDIEAEVNARGLASRVIILSPVSFKSTWSLLSGIKERHGVFTSCSTGESFGLSAAEAISLGLPVLLSDIPAHRHLVSSRSRNLYRLGDPIHWAEQIGTLLSDTEHEGQLADAFSEARFIEDWLAFLRTAGI